MEEKIYWIQNMLHEFLYKFIPKYFYSKKISERYDHKCTQLYMQSAGN
jgi:hypothetical protein